MTTMSSYGRWNRRTVHAGSGVACVANTCPASDCFDGAAGCSSAARSVCVWQIEWSLSKVVRWEHPSGSGAKTETPCGYSSRTHVQAVRSGGSEFTKRSKCGLPGAMLVRGGGVQPSACAQVSSSIQVPVALCNENKFRRMCLHALFLSHPVSK